MSISRDLHVKRDFVLQALAISEQSGEKALKDLVQNILSSSYTIHTKKTYLSWLRSQFKEPFKGSDSLSLLRVSDEDYELLKSNKSRNIQRRLANKTLISLNAHIHAVKKLVLSPSIPLIVVYKIFLYK